MDYITWDFLNNEGLLWPNLVFKSYCFEEKLMLGFNT